MGGGRAVVEAPLEDGLYTREPRYDIDSGRLRVRITAEVSEQLLNREKPIRVRILKDYSTDILKVRLENVNIRYYPVARSGAYNRGFKYCSKCQQYIHTQNRLDVLDATQN
ncbi:hypothetical protein HRbin02_00839 [Candidatus Calditenuaceae archaeon HR02]|nr:hypothetical protein HRbin02_00839 [Candidatus Calditenuaceae archaeon HR02]